MAALAVLATRTPLVIEALSRQYCVTFRYLDGRAFTSPVKGESLGLAVAVGFLSLGLGCPIPPNRYFIARVGADGEVLPLNDPQALTAKLAYVNRLGNDFKVYLARAEAAGMPDWCIGVDSLSALAAMLWPGAGMKRQRIDWKRSVEQGDRLIAASDYEKGSVVFEALLSRLKKPKGGREKWAKFMALWKSGVCLSNQGQSVEAKRRRERAGRLFRILGGEGNPFLSGEEKAGFLNSRAEDSIDSLDWTTAERTLEEAEQECERAEIRGELFGYVLNNRAYKCLRACEWSRAVTFAGRALSYLGEERNFGRAFGFMALAAAGAGDFDQAEKALAQWRSTIPRMIGVRRSNNLSYYYSAAIQIGTRRGDLKSVRSNWTRFSELPTEAQGWRIFVAGSFAAQIFMDHGDRTKAVRTLEKIVSPVSGQFAPPGRSDLLHLLHALPGLQLARCHLLTGEREENREVLDQALIRMRGCSTAWRRLGFGPIARRLRRQPNLEDIDLIIARIPTV
jgi:tetratricopeptide (TPR) repeat protein